MWKSKKGRSSCIKCSTGILKVCSGYYITIIEVRHTGDGTTHITMLLWYLIWDQILSMTSLEAKTRSRNSRLIQIAMRIQSHTHHSSNCFVFSQSRVWDNSCQRLTLLWLKASWMSTSQLTSTSIWMEELFLGKLLSSFHSLMKISLLRLSKLFSKMEWSSQNKNLRKTQPVSFIHLSHMTKT